MTTSRPSNQRENFVAGLHHFDWRLIVRSPHDCIWVTDTTSFAARSYA
jgi:hypothetical protein